MPLFELRNVHVAYGQLTAVRGVSLEVGAGEIVSLVGSNGAGKSTLLSAISGLLPIREGEILLKEARVDNLASHERVNRGIIQVPERRRIFPHMTTLENLELGSFRPEARRRKKESLHMVLELFPILAERRGQTAGLLSGGEQQMLAVGRALMACPEILMLDEPSLGLAPVIVDSLFEAFGAINEAGVSILLVEQDVQDSLALSARGYVLENGQIVLSGSSDDLLARPEIKKAYLGM